jgi:hypothetical protein
MALPMRNLASADIGGLEEEDDDKSARWSKPIFKNCIYIYNVLINQLVSCAPLITMDDDAGMDGESTQVRGVLGRCFPLP